MIQVNGNIIDQHQFGAGELNIKLDPELDNPVINIWWNYENDAELFTLACIRQHYSNRKCILNMPYLPHARMDRVKNEEDVFTLQTFAYFINTLAFEKVYILDAHSNVGPALIYRCINQSPKCYIQKAIDKLEEYAGWNKDTLCLFFPDEGAQKRYGGMFPDYKQAFGIKSRNWETGKIEGYMIIGEDNVKDNHILIIDDICSYGNTFVKAAEALHEAGANGIDLYVTHCEEAVVRGDVFKCGLIDKVFTTDSLVRSEEANSKLTIV